MADKDNPANGDRKAEDADEHRRKFARQMTRVVFGRHYWDERKQQALAAAIRKPPKRGKP